MCNTKVQYQTRWVLWPCLVEWKSSFMSVITYLSQWWCRVDPSAGYRGRTEGSSCRIYWTDGLLAGTGNTGTQDYSNWSTWQNCRTDNTGRKTDKLTKSKTKGTNIYGEWLMTKWEAGEQIGQGDELILDRCVGRAEQGTRRKRKGGPRPQTHA